MFNLQSQKTFFLWSRAFSSQILNYKYTQFESTHLQ